VNQHPLVNQEVLQDVLIEITPEVTDKLDDRGLSTLNQTNAD